MAEANNVAEPERKKRRTKVRRNYVAECAELQRRIDVAVNLLEAIHPADKEEVVGRLVGLALRQLQGKVNLTATGENA